MNKSKILFTLLAALGIYGLASCNQKPEKKDYLKEYNEIKARDAKTEYARVSENGNLILEYGNRRITYDSPAVGDTRFLTLANGKVRGDRIRRTTKEDYWQYSVWKDSSGRVRSVTIQCNDSVLVTFDTLTQTVKFEKLKVVNRYSETYGPKLILSHPEKGTYRDYTFKSK